MSLWDNRLTFEVSSAPPEAAPVWVDLTLRIRDQVQSVEVGIGRQNDLDQVEPSSITVLLDNSDDALTFGNTTSPYYPWWGPGLRCRLRETVAGTAMDRFTGFIQMPEETIVTAGIEQRVSLTAVDRLGRLAAGKAFISTLGAHIQGGPLRNAALKAYCPLLDASQPFTNTVGAPVTGSFSIGNLPPVTRAPSFGYRAGPQIPGDDMNSLAMLQGFNDIVPVSTPSITVNLAESVPVGQVVTVVAWIYREPANTSSELPLLLSIDSDFVVVNYTPGISSGPNHWELLYVGDGSLVDSTEGSANATNRWYLLGFQWGYNPNTLKLWVDDQQYTGTITTPPASATVTQLTLEASGAAAHLQCYVGVPGAFGFADFLAQRQIGLYGLERQTTGDRIRTILGYAGLNNDDFANTVDPGCSVMQRARLAGKTPLDAMREAETTEQGLLYTDGSGRVVFADRRTIYNV